jgi:hypothetical protein
MVYSITSSARVKSDLALSLNNLAGIYHKQGRLAAILQKPFSWSELLTTLRRVVAQARIH